MNFVELVVLLPCHGLEDFPLHHRGDEAESLLAAWSGLWRPELIAAVESTPRWYRMDSPPAEVRGRMIAIPSVGQDRLPIGFLDRCKNNGAAVIRRFKNRAELVAAALELLGGSPPALDESLGADFLALGFARLQIELLARHRHTSAYIDDAYFDQCAVAAAKAALVGDNATAREQLQRCFESLYESRKQHYPIDVYHIDLTLVAETTLGESLARELASGPASNVLLSGALLEQMARLRPATLVALRAAIERGAAALVGGDLDQLELPLAPIEAVFDELVAGRETLARLAGQPPKVYGRRRYGLSPTLPQLLIQLGYAGAIHATLDDGRFPLGRQGKVRWQGVDGSLIDALAHVPGDAAEPGAFLEFSRKLAESMDMDHVATMTFAHWPSMASPWLDDLRRVASHSPALGKFVRLDQYFAETALPLVQARFKADEYRSPYLNQAVMRRAADPISRYVKAHQDEANRAAAAALRLLASLMGPAQAQPAGVSDAASAAQFAGQERDQNPVEQELDDALRRFAAALPRAAGPTSSGSLLVNPLSFSAAHRLPDPAAPSAAVPAMGYLWLDRTPDSGAKRAAKPVADKNTLTGDHLLITISSTSGGAQAIHDLKRRANRLSQRLALRMPGELPQPGEPWRDPDETACYAEMVADAVEPANLDADTGEILSTGRLVDAQRRTLATFRQRVRLRRDSRVARFEVELEPGEPLRADPWNSYYASRIAWSDPGAALYRGVHLGRQPTEAQRLEAPEYIDIVEAAGNLTLLCGGHPYHRRVGPRMIDTLLVVKGEVARRFVFGIGVELPHPHAAALELLRPPLAIDVSASLPPASRSGWLFHLDTRHVVATRWAPLYASAGSDESSRSSDASGSGALGRPLGFRVRLLEATGQSCRVRLRAPWPLSMARRTNFLGETLGEIAVEEDTAIIDISGHEWIEVEAWWS